MLQSQPTYNSRSDAIPHKEVEVKMGDEKEVEVLGCPSR